MSGSLVAALDSELSVDYAFRELSLEEIDLVGGGGWWTRFVAWVGGVWETIQEFFGGEGEPNVQTGPGVTVINNGDNNYTVIYYCGCGCGG
jgi:hypothetical protein